MKKRHRAITIKSLLIALLAVAVVVKFTGYVGVARGATVTTFSDTLTTSIPSVVANHTIAWDVVDATGIAANDVFTINFADTFDTATGPITENDIDIEDDGTDKTTAADCTGAEEFGVAINTSTDVITFTACTELTTIAQTSVVTVKIGTNADNSGTGTQQIINPTAGSLTISLAGTSGYTDSGEIQVAILAGVDVSATVSAALDVSVAGLNTGSVNSAVIDETDTSATAITFGTLTVNTHRIAAQTVTVSTNASEGYTTAIRWTTGSGSDDGLDSNTNNCDGFTASTATNASPQAWAAGTNPTGSAANVDTCWFGYTTEDSALGVGTAARFTTGGGDKWAPFSSTAYEVIYTANAVSAQATNIGYKVEVNGIQPQGTYTGTTEFITTAIF